jgi:hypothetical protein
MTNMYDSIFGKQVVKIGTRYFAIRKDTTRADRIHATTQLGSSWDRQMTKPALRVRNTRSIRA